jgi:hypothetical protein
VPGTADPTLGVNGGLQGLLMRKLAVADDGAIAVVNSSFREGEISRVRLIRGRVERPRATLGSRSVSTVGQLHGAINHCLDDATRGPMQRNDDNVGDFNRRRDGRQTRELMVVTQGRRRMRPMLREHPSNAPDNRGV